MGEEVATLFPDASGLHQGAGENGPLKAKGYFAPSPHLIAETPACVAALEAAEIGTASIGDDRYLVGGRFILDATNGRWHDGLSRDRGDTILSLIAAFEDAELFWRSAPRTSVHSGVT